MLAYALALLCLMPPTGPPCAARVMCMSSETTPNSSQFQFSCGGKHTRPPRCCCSTSGEFSVRVSVWLNLRVTALRILSGCVVVLIPCTHGALVHVVSADFVVLCSPNLCADPCEHIKVADVVVVATSYLARSGCDSLSNIVSARNSQKRQHTLCDARCCVRLVKLH